MTYPDACIIRDSQTNSSGDESAPRPPWATPIKLVAIAISILVAIAGAALPSDSAEAASTPSWKDVEKARSSESATLAAIARIEAALEQLESDAARAKAVSEIKGTLYQTADQDFQKAASRRERLSERADAATATAELSTHRAAEIAASRYRQGDATLVLLTNEPTVDGLLSAYATADKLTARFASIYETARIDQNVAEGLEKQANAAGLELARLREIARSAAESAQAAADVANASVDEHIYQKSVLNAQLAVLTERRNATQADFDAGERARAEAEAARKAAEEGAHDGVPPNPGGGSTPAPGGWAKPTVGAITSGYGMRLNPYSGVWRMHAGTDMSSGCGTPIYAAHAGTVGYAAWFGSYGNFIEIQAGGGTSTGYAHIADRGTLVGKGQSVFAGQLIAYVGSTGGSTGCHLHFEVRTHGITSDPVPYMLARGITLG